MNVATEAMCDSDHDLSHGAFAPAVTGFDVRTGQPLRIRGLSLQGFVVETDAALPAGSIHKVTFASGAGPAVLVRLRSQGSREWRVPNDGCRFLTDVDFLDARTPGARIGFGSLLEKLGPLA